MKVFVVLIMAVAGVLTGGSGPYLPKGWKPEGPAFYLPSEETVQLAPVPKVEQEVVNETEASGSNGFKEYGPPKLESSVNTIQELPQATTEQITFRAINNEVEAIPDGVNIEVLQDNQEIVPEIVPTILSEVEDSEISQEQKDVGLENVAVEIATEQIQQSINIDENAADVISSTISGSLEQSPKSLEDTTTGFVAYGYPVEISEKLAAENEESINVDQNAADAFASTISGSLEQSPKALEDISAGIIPYGLVREISENLAAEVEDTFSLENNEVRRRRFSPKFRSKKQH